MNVRPLELKKQIVNAYLRKEGTQLQLAKRYNVSVTSVNHWIRLFRECGSLEVSPWKKGPAPRVKGQQVEELRVLVAANPYATLAQLCDLFQSKTGIKVSISSMDRYLRSHAISRKNTHQSVLISNESREIAALIASSDLTGDPEQN
jgi:transposase